jgi:hypothetical protein
MTAPPRCLAISHTECAIDGGLPSPEARLLDPGSCVMVHVCFSEPGEKSTIKNQCSLSFNSASARVACSEEFLGPPSVSKRKPPQLVSDWNAAENLPLNSASSVRALSMQIWRQLIHISSRHRWLHSRSTTTHRRQSSQVFLATSQFPHPSSFRRQGRNPRSEVIRFSRS